MDSSTSSEFSLYSQPIVELERSPLLHLTFSWLLIAALFFLIGIFA